MRRRLMPRRALLAILLAGFAPPSFAGTVIYRCTDAAGAVTLQNDVPCAKGQRQEKRTVEPLAPVPAYVPAPMPEPGPAAAPEPQPGPDPATADVDAGADDAARLPPPPLYRCRTWDDDSYLGEDPSPPPRCALLQTTGLGGDPGRGAGAACEMHADTCDRVADGELCAAWKTQLRSAESAWKFARPEAADEARAEYDRLAKLVAASTCGG